MTYGIVSGYAKSCQQRYEQADDLYGYANWALSGIPDMVKGAFNPEKPYSFDHVMNSIGVASLVVGAYAGYKHSYNSNNITKQKSCYSKDATSSSNNHWGNLETLDSHFERHGKDFNAPNASAYAQMANDFYNNRYNYQIKIDSDGIIRVYDAYSNTFGAYNPDGTSRTFFKPKSKNYFNNQPGELLENN